MYKNNIIMKRNNSPINKINLKTDGVKKSCLKV